MSLKLSELVNSDAVHGMVEEKGYQGVDMVFPFAGRLWKRLLDIWREGS